MRRREFLATLGLAAGGLVVGLRPRRASAYELSPSVIANDFVHIAVNGRVTIVCARSEMGQGVRSSLPVLIADELGADMARVQIVQAEGDKKYGDQNTDGSSSVRGHFETLRQHGATARLMLVETAAQQWGVAPGECTAREHVIWHDRTKRTLAFGELVPEAMKRKPNPKAPLRPRAELTHVGTNLPLLDGPDIVTGRAQYGADVKLPNMLIAVIARPPVVGGKASRWDPSKALAVKGVVKVFELPVPTGAVKFQPLGGIAIIAENTWAALEGRRAMPIEWDHGDNASYDSAAFQQSLLATVRAPQKSVRSTGDVDKALDGAAKRLEAEYYVPHLAHVPMEPPAAIARFVDGKCEAWACTQNPQAARTEVARALGIGEDKVRINVTLLGGGFGRKSKPDYVAEAALLSREAGAPVRVQWTREDDIHHDYFHTVSAQRLEAGIDASNKVVAWRHRIAFPTIGSTFAAGTKRPADFELGQGATDIPLAIPSVRVEAGEADAHVRIGWLRSVCNIFHGFALGSFIDEIARARGVDARDNWLEILGPPRNVTPKEAGIDKFANYGAPIDEHPIDVLRYRGVIEKVCQSAGWGTPQKEGRALGLSAHASFLTRVAVVAAVQKSESGAISVDEVWITADAGTIINEERVRSQLEGAVMFGMSIAFGGAVTMRGGQVVQTNFRDVPILRIGDAPRKIHVDIVKSDKSPGGVGEPGVPPVAPAILNAIFALTGQRVRDLPYRLPRSS